MGHLLLALLLCQAVPDGTVVLSKTDGLILNALTGLHWTHAAIVLDDTVYEAAWPRVRKVPLSAIKRRHVMIPPSTPLTRQQIAAMVRYAEGSLGRRYMLRGWLFPRNYGRTRGVYCSEFAARVLIAGGAHISLRSGYTPDVLEGVLIGADP
jgi:uncharacterized protein YycO